MKLMFRVKPLFENLQMSTVIAKYMYRKYYCESVHRHWGKVAQPFLADGHFGLIQSNIITLIM